MNLSKMKKQIVTVAFGLVVCTSALANQWRPISSERLIKLPALVMAKALEQDFRDSDLATSLTTSQKSLGNIKVSLERLTPRSWHPSPAVRHPPPQSESRGRSIRSFLAALRSHAVRVP